MLKCLGILGLVVACICTRGFIFVPLHCWKSECSLVVVSMVEGVDIRLQILGLSSRRCDVELL